MSIDRGPGEPPTRLTWVEVDRLKSVHPTPYLDEPDLEVYAWPLPTATTTSGGERALTEQEWDLYRYLWERWREATNG